MSVRPPTKQRLTETQIIATSVIYWRDDKMEKSITGHDRMQALTRIGDKKAKQRCLQKVII